VTRRQSAFCSTLSKLTLPPPFAAAFVLALDWSLSASAEGGAARARDANLERRGEVRAVIGLAAEELAYLYSALERRHLFGNAVRSGDYAANDLFAKVEVPVSETTLRSLFELDAANFVEGPLTRFGEFDGEFLARYRSLWEAAQRFVTRQAYAAVFVLSRGDRAEAP
jgi:hypothetical protein